MKLLTNVSIVVRLENMEMVCHHLSVLFTKSVMVIVSALLQ